MQIGIIPKGTRRSINLGKYTIEIENTCGNVYFTLDDEGLLKLESDWKKNFKVYWATDADK